MAREYYSIPEAAVILGISRIAAFKRVKKGRLEALRFGRNWAVPAAALERPAMPGRKVSAPADTKGPRHSPPARADAELDSMGWD